MARRAGRVWHCDRCESAMHEVCYFGRVTTLIEWQDHRCHIASTEQEYTPTVVCAQCRAKGEGT